MRFAKSLAMFAVAGVFSVASIACGDDDIEDNSSSSGASGQSSGASGGSSGASGGSSGASGGSSGASGDGGTNDFVQYVYDQIVDHTRNNTPTDTLNDKTFTESERSDLFDPAFFAGSYEQ